jgi:parallel beta-helix repeat protein
MKRLVLAALVATIVAGSGPAAASTPGTLIVDDDGAQCGEATYTSIQAAVGEAQPGAVIRVCPGHYAESVTVDKPLTLKGDPEAVEAVDCFESAPSQLGDLDPARHVIVDGTGSSAHELFRLRADRIVLEGFVLQGASSAPLPADTRFYRRAIDTSAANSGYHVHHNLIRSNTVGALFRSSGVLPSSFDHNCLRDNGWGLANHWLPLVDARIHHNSTFRTANFAFEQTGDCPEFWDTGLFDACSPTRMGMDGVVFDHNVSVGDDTGYRLASSSSTTAFENSVISARIGMRLVGAADDLRIIDNHLQVTQTGLARLSTATLLSNFGVLIQGNTIAGSPGTGAGIGMGARGLKNSQILGNVISGLDGEGIALLAGNTGNLVRGNTVTNNGSNGIRVADGATGNTFEANQMLGNGRIVTTAVDARDDAREFNVWRGNLCLTDIPVGTICGIGSLDTSG